METFALILSIFTGGQVETFTMDRFRTYEDCSRAVYFSHQYEPDANVIARMIGAERAAPIAWGCDTESYA